MNNGFDCEEDKFYYTGAPKNNIMKKRAMGIAKAILFRCDVCVQ